MDCITTYPRGSSQELAHLKPEPAATERGARSAGQLACCAAIASRQQQSSPQPSDTTTVLAAVRSRPQPKRFKSTRAAEERKNRTDDGNRNLHSRKLGAYSDLRVSGYWVGATTFDR